MNPLQTQTSTNSVDIHWIGQWEGGKLMRELFKVCKNDTVTV